jgi:hypothetical protein
MMTMIPTRRLPALQQMASRRRFDANTTSAHRHHVNNNNNNKQQETFLVVSRRLYFSMLPNTSTTSSGVFKDATLLRNNKNRQYVIIRPYLSSSMTSPEKLQGAMQTARRRVVAEQQQDAVANNGYYWQRAFQWYSRKLSTHPLITKSLTSAIIAGLGDVLCQAAMYNDDNDSLPATATTNHENDENNNKEPSKVSSSSSTSRRMICWLHSFWTTGWDAQCTCIFALLGFTFVAPTSHYWYEALAKHAWTTGQSLTNISKRVFLDQFVWTPIFFVIWLTSFWTLQDNITIINHSNSSNGSTTAAVATNKNSNSNSDTPTAETPTAASASTSSSSAHKISSQLAQHLPDVMIAVGSIINNACASKILHSLHFSSSSSVHTHLPELDPLDSSSIHQLLCVSRQVSSFILQRFRISVERLFELCHA